MGASGATTTFIPAAVQGTITGYAVGVAEDGAASLAALARGGALPAKADRPASAAGGTADAVAAKQAAAAVSIHATPAAVVVTAVQNTIRVDPVRRANRSSQTLAALPGLRTFGAEW
ncbi:MAG: hypothetical protein KY456_03595 [Chloroflexi bacterium]|nr:hypothetical protein [Chloroflexota bacterium]